MSCLGLLHFAKSGIANELRIILLFKASTIGRAVQILIMKHFCLVDYSSKKLPT